MPCYVIVTVSIAFKVENKDLFKKTLEVMDWTKRNEMSGVVNVEDDRGNNISFDLINNKVSSKDYIQSEFSNKLNSFKRSYSAQALGQLAKKKKWILQQKKENEFQLKRF